MSGGPHGPEFLLERLNDGYDDDPLVSEALGAMYTYARGNLAHIHGLDDAALFLDLWSRSDDLNVYQHTALLDRLLRLSDGGSHD